MVKIENWEILEQIYEKVGISKSDSYFKEEVNGWNQTYLPLLNSEIELYLSQGDDVKENLKFLLENPHNLKQVLLNPHLSNKYSRYNCEFSFLIHCIEEFDASNWFFWNTPINIEIPDGSGNKIEVTKCENSFSKDYPIGNYSQNCFQIGGNERKEYRKFLLEYFLDTSIQIFYISLVSSRGKKEIIGEINFTLKEDENKKIYLVVTSLELKGIYEDDEHFPLHLAIFNFINIFSKKISDNKMDFIVFKVNGIASNVLDKLSEEVGRVLNVVNSSRIDSNAKEEYRTVCMNMKKMIDTTKKRRNVESQKTRKLFYNTDPWEFSGTCYYDLYSRKRRRVIERYEFNGSVIQTDKFNQVNGYFFQKDFEFMIFYLKLLEIRAEVANYNK